MGFVLQPTLLIVPHTDIISGGSIQPKIYMTEKYAEEKYTC
jgi:hypothetical protein